MKTKIAALRSIAAIFAVLLPIAFFGTHASFLRAREKNSTADSNDSTSRLFQLLDDSRGGKLSDFYVLADTYKDGNNPPEEFQHVLRVDYDKNRGFGKLNLHVRTLAKIAPEQLKTYTPKQIYEFGVEDTEKYLKSEIGPLGRPGDMYLRAAGDRPLASSPITDETRKAYESFLDQYLIPALQKK